MRGVPKRSSSRMVAIACLAITATTVGGVRTRAEAEPAILDPAGFTSPEDLRILITPIYATPDGEEVSLPTLWELNVAKGEAASLAALPVTDESAAYEAPESATLNVRATFLFTEGGLTRVDTLALPLERAGSVYALAEPELSTLTISPSPAVALPAATNCGVTSKKLATSDQYMTIGELHSGIYMTSYWGMVNNADSTVTMGTSRDGKTWAVKGAVTLKDSASTWAEVSVTGSWARTLRSLFRYGKYQTHVVCEGYVASSGYEVRADDWLGGGVNGADVSSQDGFSKWNTATQGGTKNEVELDPGWDWGREENKAKLYMGAVSVFGASLDATTGFSKTVKLHYHNPQNSDRTLHLFNNAAPPKVAQVVNVYVGPYLTGGGGSGGCKLEAPVSSDPGLSDGIDMTTSLSPPIC